MRPSPRPDFTLDADQQQAAVVDHASGSLLVTGPPGSGKTVLLRERFARLVEAGADPERILLLTLNRRAARDAREHIVRRLDRSLPEVPALTAHGLAYRILGRRFEEAGYEEPPHLLSAPEQYAAVGEMLAAEDPKDWPAFGGILGRPGFVRQVGDFVLRTQERLLDPDGLELLVERAGLDDYREVSSFYRRYREAQRSRGRVDFAGLLFEAVALLERSVGDDAFDHLLVDDYQDATPAAEAVLRILARAATSTVVAADPHGHVFSYQGGSLEPLGRLGDTLGGLARVGLTGSRRLGKAVTALGPLEDPSARPGAAPQNLEARLFPHPGEEADAVAHDLVRARVDEGVPWEDMAVIVRRYGDYVTALRHALVRHGVPFVVVAEAADVAAEPANRPVIDVLRYVFQHRTRDELLDRVLTGPLVGLDPHGVRRLRRQAHLGDSTLRDLLESHAAKVDDDLAEPVARFRRLVDEMPGVSRDRGPDGLFFWLWADAELDHFRSLADAPDHQRDVDALAALGDMLSRFVERRPGATIEDYLHALDAAEFGPDPYLSPEERYPHAVRVVSAHRAHGLEFEVVFVVGCLEGEFPSLGRGQPLLDVRGLEKKRTPGERLRARLAEERALFRLAISRARRRTVLTASHSTSARNPRTPSRFAGRMGLQWPEVAEVPPAASLRTVEASLRKVLADGTSSRPARLAALAALPKADASPRTWAGGREWTDPGTPLHEGDIVTSYSRFSVLENCDLQYLYEVEMGLDPTRSHHMWTGSLIHDLIDRVQRGELDRTEEAMLAALDEAWQPEVFPNRALEEQRYLDARKMIRLWLEDPGYGEVLASEKRFEFPLDGTEIHGRIDAVFRFGDDGTGVRVVDYKTSKSRPTKEEVQESLQLAAYFLAMRRDPELRELGEPRLLELGFLFHEGTDPGYRHEHVQVDRFPGGPPEYEAWAERRILELLERVRGERFGPNPEANCRWCRCKPICPVWPQGAEVTT